MDEASQRLDPRLIGYARLVAARRILLPDVERLGFRAIPRYWSMRHIVGTLTWMSVAAATRVQSALKIKDDMAEEASELGIEYSSLDIMLDFDINHSFSRRLIEERLAKLRDK